MVAEVTDSEATRYGLNPSDRCARCGIGLIRSHRIYTCRWHGRWYRRHHARGLCKSCFTLARRNDTIADYQRATLPNDLLLEEWDLTCRGMPLREAAGRLGVSPRWLALVLKQHRPDAHELRAYSTWGAA